MSDNLKPCPLCGADAEMHYEKLCVCGARVEANTGGYDCPRCFRHYNIKGKLIGNNQMIQFCENAERQDIKTMHYDEKHGEKM